MRYSILVADSETTKYYDAHGEAAKIFKIGYSKLLSFELSKGHVTNLIKHKFKVETFDTIADFETSIQAIDAHPIVYFYNLKFDASYLLSRDELTIDNPIITNFGEWFGLTINGIEYRDMMKLYMGGIANVGKTVGYAKLKDVYRYDRIRTSPSDWNADEVRYFERDIEIMHEKMTQHFDDFPIEAFGDSGSYGESAKIAYSAASLAYNALLDETDSDFKRESYAFESSKETEKELKRVQLAREAYFGGFSHLNPEYQSRVIGVGGVIDKNSMYPHQMTKDMYTTIGKPLTFKQWASGISKRRDYIVTFNILALELKQGAIPTLPKKLNRKNKNDEITTLSDLDGFVTVTLLAQDFEHMVHNYHAKIDFVKAYRLKGEVNFKTFIHNWYAKKEQYSRDGDQVGKMLAKIMLNSSYGKFGQRAEDTEALIAFNQFTGTFGITYPINPKSHSKPRNVLVAAQITANARDDLYNSIYKVQASDAFKFVYADTDSIHVEYQHADETIETANEKMKAFGFEIDTYKLGAWKIESDFKQAKFIRSKIYFEKQQDDTYQIKGAGITAEGKAVIEQHLYENDTDFFEYGMTLPARQSILIRGGRVIIDTFKQITGKGLH